MKCIFGNRLTTEQHKDQFNDILKSASRNLFNVDQTNYFFVSSGNQSTALQYMTQSDWTDIVKRNITICSEFQLKSLRIDVDYRHCFDKFWITLDTDDIGIHAVVNELLLETTASICRALSRIESHVLLAGPTGSIKNDALHIACIYLGIKFTSITPVKQYNINDFYNDLKMVRDFVKCRSRHRNQSFDHKCICNCYRQCNQQHWMNIMWYFWWIIRGFRTYRKFWIPSRPCWKAVKFRICLEMIWNRLRNHWNRWHSRTVFRNHWAHTFGHVTDFYEKYFYLKNWTCSQLSLNISGIRQRLHIVLCLESESHNANELFDSYPSLYKCTEIIWMASTAIPSPEYVAKELTEKLYNDIVPAPTKYLNIIDACHIDWQQSTCRFSNLIFTYGTFYKDMLATIQKQQNILQVKTCLVT